MRFCKTEMTLIFRYGKLVAIDEKWEITRNAHEEKLMELDDKIDGIEATLNENPNDAKLKSEFAKLKSKIEKLEDSFDNKEEKIYDRQGTWEQKWIDRSE